jgi:tetratricopeptide (TPR) repeat protein
MKLKSRLYKFLLGCIAMLWVCVGPFQAQEKLDLYIATFENGDVDEKIGVFSELFNTLDRSYPDSTFHYINVLQQVALKEDREDALAFANYYFANYLMNKSLFDEVEKKLELAKSYFEYDENDSTLAEVLNAYGNMHYLKGNYKKAEESYLKSIGHGNKSHDPKFAYFGRINLVRVYIALDREDEALETLNEVLDFYTAKSDARQIASAYGLLGQIAMGNNDLDKAIEHYERSLEYNLVNGSNLMIANGYTNMAIAAFYKEEYDKSEQYFLLALNYREKTENHFFISESHHNLGSFFHAIGKYDLAAEYFTKALEIAEFGGIKSAISDAYEGLSEVHEAKKEFQLQAEYLKKKIALDRSIFNERSSEELNLLRVSFANEREQLKLQNAKRMKALESRVDGVYQTWNIWIWVVVSCIILIVALLYFKNKSKVIEE